MCDATMASCECSLDNGHDGPHVCACLGSWADDGSIHAWPEEYQGPPEGYAGYLAVMPLLRDLSEMLPFPGPAYNTDSSQDTRIGPAEVGGEVAPAPDRRRPASAEERVGGADNTDSGQEAR